MGGTTSKMGIPYPDNNDFVTDGATDMQSLAEEIDLRTGLVSIVSNTFSATANLVLDDIFSSDFTNYKIHLMVDSISASAGISMQFRDGTSNASGSNYMFSGTFTSGGSNTIAAFRNNSQTSVANVFVPYDNNDYGSLELEVFRPQETAYTTFLGRGINYRPTPEFAEYRQFGGAYDATTTLEGIRFFTAGATFSGKYTIYGYN